MIERLHHIKDCITLLLAKNQDMPQITTDEWQLADDLLNLLAPLEDITRKLCTDNMATISMVIPSLFTANKALGSLTIRCQTALRFRVVLIDALKGRFTGVEVDPIYQIATLLDPRFKANGFRKAEHSDEAKLALQKELSNNSSVLAPIDTNANRSNESNQTSSKKGRFDLFSSLNETISSNNSNVSTDSARPQSCLDELNNFMCLERVDSQTDVFKWWYDRRYQFPNLYKLVLKYMYIPASSASSERVFSAAGLLINQKRSRLTGQHVNMLLFLNQNKF